ncbi:photosystem I assembly protein Ycf3 [Anatilimnocola aggregata]|uniref:Photosystem I assembly protein Ycf3 n=1 Tax=Anatilimnocola aggregata TaxID=2528021 RepID=A0A517YGT0_9BACT|nr:tetratricopeptide repeat protein [Anatilimnocola aggregata]QDU29433.1 photosystem I assembly protein Ycf3 [Anatilimnocola aggregata]
MNRILLFATLILFRVLQTASAADGYMVTVTPGTAQIKSAKVVLAVVPRGTRLWIFEEKGDWLRVKVPNAEVRGWISAQHVEKIQLSPARLENAKLASAHWDRGLNLIGREKYPEAIYELNQCLVLELQVHGDDHPDSASTRGLLGSLIKDVGDYALARKHFDAALVTQRSTLGNEHADTGMMLCNIGTLLCHQHNYAEGRKYFEEALAIHLKLHGNEHSDTVGTLNNLGNATTDQGDYSTARKYYDEALAIQRKLFGNEHANTAMTLNNIGTVERMRGDYTAARQFFEESLVVYRKVFGNEATETASSMNNLAAIAHEQGDYSIARKLCDEALAVRRKVLGNDHLETAASLNNLGNLVSDQGDNAAARKFYDEALAVYRKVLGNESAAVALTLNNLGALALDQGDIALAKQLHEESLTIRRKVLGNDHPDTAGTLQNLGILVCNQGDYAAARQLYVEALAIRRRVCGNEHADTAGALINLGILEYDQKNYAAARACYDEALAINRKVLGSGHPSTGDIYENMAWLEDAENDLSAAGECFNQARRIFRFHQLRTLSSLSEAAQLLFLTNKHANNWYESLSFGRRARANANVAELSAGWLINGKGMAEESLSIGSQLFTPETVALIGRLRKVRGELAEVAHRSLSDEPEQRRTELQSEEERLVRQLGQVRGEDLTTDPWFDIISVRKVIPKKSMLINIVRFAPFDSRTEKPGDSLYVAWLIPSANDGEVKIVDIGNADVIDTAVATFRKAMSMAGTATSKEKEKEKEAHFAADKALACLAELTLKPLSEHLSGKEGIILSPDSALWLVPWGALPVEEGKVLIENYSLKYVVSGRELIAKSKAKVVEKSVVLADPDFDFAKIVPLSLPITKPARRSNTRLDRAERLRGTATEAVAIAPSLKAYTKRDPFVYLDREATEGRFKQLVSPQVLVLGTHGFYFPEQEVEIKDEVRGVLSGQGERRSVRTKDGQPLENPLLRCGVLLAGCNRTTASDKAGLDDGVLTGLEIVNADLRGTELVVLSACETGLGDVRNGEGVAGLRQAFQLAGAKAVVSTLWQIPDNESAQLMSDFFGYLAEGKSKAEALRFAQLNRIVEHREREGSAPAFYWGAFTLTE